MEEFLRTYIRRPYDLKIVARFLNAFDSRLEHLSYITSLSTFYLKDLKKYDEVRNGPRFWERGHMEEFQRVGKIFWSKIQACPYNILVKEKEVKPKLQYSMGSDDEKEPTLEEIINDLGKVDYKSKLITCNDLYKEFRKDSVRMSVSDLISDLKSMRNTIRILDLSKQSMGEHMDVLINELQHHSTLIELNLRKNELDDDYCENLCKLKLEKINLEKNPYISEEMIIRLKESIAIVIH